MLGKLLGRDAAAEVGRGIVSEPKLVDEKADCLGIESGGSAQVRGNCCLLLGAEELVWVMWKPQSTHRIARGKFRSVEVVRSHLGKSRGFKLVKLVFENDEGASDSVAWLVQDLEGWVDQLKSAIAE